MENKRRGPVTIPGKKISSRNATKHGATAKGFINEQERERSLELLLDLNKHYQSNNPLIKLQLERIARVTIQLERIQNTIDAFFERSRAKSNLEDNLMEYLKVSPNQRMAVFLKKLGIAEPANKTEDLIRHEVIANRFQPPTNQQEFLNASPTLCVQLYRSACLKKQSINEYIENQTRDGNTKSGIPPRSLVTNESLGEVGGNNASKNGTLKEAILKTDLINIQQVIHWKLTEIQGKQDDLKKLEDFDKLLPIEERAATPNLDQLDKLMRYQTTLQRQLSTTIGELMVLNKQDF